ncbi:hypothetical protein [Reyranella soli]|uniref:hypothetical protein n=1 Tax=Reyranella soli TaxID=1230389 RepID=UPI0011BE09FD|nr:hypothetical protein [Reyranella soli]
MIGLLLADDVALEVDGDLDGLAVLPPALFHCAAQSASDAAQAVAGSTAQDATSTASADFLLIARLHILWVGLPQVNETTGNPLRRGCVPEVTALNPGRRHNAMEG